MPGCNEWTNTPNRSSRLLQAIVVMAIVSMGGSVAQAQKSMPDAQVEANVLKALASAPELAGEAIATHTVYGTVTLSGSVATEAARSKAETLAANAQGVVKVIDELRLGVAAAPAVAGNASTGGSAAPLVLQSDGTYAPAASETGGIETAEGSAASSVDRTGEASANPGVPSQPGQAGEGSSNADIARPPYPSARGGRRPMYAPGNSGYGNPGHGNPGYGYPQGSGAPYRQSEEQNRPGQPGGQTVMVPAGALLHVRVNRTLSSDHTPAGSVFDGILVNDVVAEGQVAIPRGAEVRGTVVDATASHALKGRGELSIQLTEVTLGGKSYPIATDLWAHHGGDKTIETVNKTAGLGAVGAVFGALAGGGVGAAVGGGIGAAAGLGSSAASGNGQVYVPAESILTFHTTASASVTTVSTDEMLRLAYGVAPPGPVERPVRRPYPRVYVGPGYYAGYPYPYRPYPVYPYPYY